MKTILDLIAEFASLNETKVRSGGRLDPEGERRFSELKSFYDLLMSHSGLSARLSARRVARRFSAEDVLKKVTARQRLRVPVEVEMAYAIEGEYRAALAVNLSRGGVFLSTREILPARTPVTVYLSTMDASNRALIEAPARVVWNTDRGLSHHLLPPGMGVHFVEKQGLVERYLDAMVIDALVRHLSGVDANSLAPEFIGRELVEL